MKALDYVMAAVGPFVAAFAIASVFVHACVCQAWTKDLWWE